LRDIVVGMEAIKTSLDHNVAIITGGASGIGRAIGEELASRGCEVVLADRQHDLAIKVAEDIVAKGGRARGALLDVRSMPAQAALVKETVERTGRIDYFFNNAGIGVGGEMDNYSPEDWDDVIDVNLRGVAYGIQAVYPTMVAQRSGHIVNTASMAGLISTPGEISYGATKHAVVGLSKSLRIEARGHGVRVSVLCPGAIRTPILTGGVFGRSNVENISKEEILRMWERMRPMAPERFARNVIDRVLRDEAIIIEPRWWAAFWILERVSPTLTMRLGEVVLTRMRAAMAAAGGRPKKKTPT
jgi:NAD(P)-dependent dehydrogenase (short-subunit alcohol dehydrogenase family)